MVHVNRMTIASYEERVPKTVNYTGALNIIDMLTYSLAKNKFWLVDSKLLFTKKFIYKVNKKEAVLYF